MVKISFPKGEQILIYVTKNNQVRVIKTHWELFQPGGLVHYEEEMSRLLISDSPITVMGSELEPTVVTDRIIQVSSIPEGEIFRIELKENQTLELTKKSKTRAYIRYYNHTPVLEQLKISRKLISSFLIGFPVFAVACFFSMTISMFEMEDHPLLWVSIFGMLFLAGSVIVLITNLIFSLFDSFIQFLRKPETAVGNSTEKDLEGKRYLGDFRIERNLADLKKLALTPLENESKIRTAVEQLSQQRIKQRQANASNLILLQRLARTMTTNPETNHLVDAELEKWLLETNNLKAKAAVIAGWLESIPAKVEKQIFHRSPKTLETILRKKLGFTQRDLAQMIKLGHFKSGTIQYDKITKDEEAGVSDVSGREPSSYDNQIRNHTLYGLMGEGEVRRILPNVESIHVPKFKEWLEQKLHEIAPQAKIRSILVYGSYIYGIRPDPTDLDVYVILENTPQDFKSTDLFNVEINKSIFEADFSRFTNHADIHFRTLDNLYRDPENLTLIANVGIVLAGDGLKDTPFSSARKSDHNRAAKALNLLKDAEDKISRTHDTKRYVNAIPVWRQKAVRRLEEANLLLAKIDPSLAIPFGEIRKLRFALRLFMEDNLSQEQFEKLLWAFQKRLWETIPLARTSLIWRVLQRSELRNDGVINSPRAPEAVGAYPHARRIGNQLFLSGVGPRKRDSKIIPGVQPYDIETQIRTTFENIRMILEDAGSSWNQIAEMKVYLTHKSQGLPTFKRIWREYFPKTGSQPELKIVSVRALPTPIAFEAKVRAVMEGPKPTSLLMLTLLLSFVPLKSNVDDIKSQMREVFQHLKALLDDAASSWEQIVDIEVSLGDMKRDFPKYNDLWSNYFPDPNYQPTRTTVEKDRGFKMKVIASQTPSRVELRNIDNWKEFDSLISSLREQVPELEALPKSSSWKYFPGTFNNPSFKGLREYVIASIRPWVIENPNAKLVDFGGGKGEWSEFLKSVFPNLDIVNIDKIEPPQTSAIPFLQADGEDLGSSISNSSTDIVISLFAVDYMNRHKVIREIKRILRSGGHALLLFHHPDSPVVDGVQESAHLASSVLGFVNQSMDFIQGSENQAEEPAWFSEFERIIHSRLARLKFGSTASLNALIHLLRFIHQERSLAIKTRMMNDDEISLLVRWCQVMRNTLQRMLEVTPIADESNLFLSEHAIHEFLKKHNLESDAIIKTLDLGSSKRKTAYLVEFTNPRAELRSEDVESNDPVYFPDPIYEDPPVFLVTDRLIKGVQNPNSGATARYASLTWLWTKLQEDKTLSDDEKTLLGKALEYRTGVIFLRQREYRNRSLIEPKLRHEIFHFVAFSKAEIEEIFVKAFEEWERFRPSLVHDLTNVLPKYEQVWKERNWVTAHELFAHLFESPRSGELGFLVNEMKRLARSGRQPAIHKAWMMWEQIRRDSIRKARFVLHHARTRQLEKPELLRKGSESRAELRREINGVSNDVFDNVQLNKRRQTSKEGQKLPSINIVPHLQNYPLAPSFSALSAKNIAEPNNITSATTDTSLVKTVPEGENQIAIKEAPKEISPRRKSEPEMAFLTGALNIRSTLPGSNRNVNINNKLIDKSSIIKPRDEQEFETLDESLAIPAELSEKVDEASRKFEAALAPVTPEMQKTFGDAVGIDLVSSETPAEDRKVTTMYGFVPSFGSDDGLVMATEKMIAGKVPFVVFVRTERDVLRLRAKLPKGHRMIITTRENSAEILDGISGNVRLVLSGADTKDDQQFLKQLAGVLNQFKNRIELVPKLFPLQEFEGLIGISGLAANFRAELRAALERAIAA